MADCCVTELRDLRDRLALLSLKNRAAGDESAATAYMACADMLDARLRELTPEPPSPLEQLLANAKLPHG